MDLKDTLNLPHTAFSMKANLPVMEPRMLARWQENHIYQKIREARKGRPTFVLHDGPPFSNGHIHLGHACNKILKDLTIKSKAMGGFDTPYLPGWDCHGLPIEIKVVAQKRSDLDVLEVRRQCRQYAEKFVGIQREEFQRLGVFGEWDKPYLTMSHEYEAGIVRLFGRFVEMGSVYKGLKPVHWCISCETALAEAEVEYGDHTSPSIYVKFPVQSGLEAICPQGAGRPAFVLIWTTTPWTLPANLALCYHRDYEYALVEVGSGELFLMASALVERVAHECGFATYQVLCTVRGDALGSLVTRHPWLPRDAKTVFGTHVTLDQGTGVVHTAPGHGQEDYLTGVEYGLDIYCPVDGSGKFTAEVEHFAGLPVFEANPRITSFLAEQGVLVASREVVHSYPHCWRCHQPVVFRATPQWFISMEHADLRSRALQAIRKVTWKPVWGEERIYSMIANRPDWCISRQRLWGVPITAFYCRDCRRPLISARVVEHVARIFAKESADAWYLRSSRELLPPRTKCICGGTDFEKEYDILDVWFESGSSHHVVLGNRDDLPWPADMYLEGGDQYRGWFHSSLLVAIGARSAAPYQTVVCHGFTLDADGRAMSKSLGNVISPLDVIKENGAEILRLWVASIDYTEDARLDEEILSRLREAYRKLRNTSRFLLANLYDFDPAKAAADTELSELDRWVLARAAWTADHVEEAYQHFEFHVVYHTLYNFCVVDLSSFYLDILKDRLYTAAPNSVARRSAQTALFKIADMLVRLLAPILCFTADEIWSHLYPQGGPVESVHMAEFSREMDRYRSPELLQRWERFQQIREQVSRKLEESRQRKEMGNSLEARVDIRCGPKTLAYLKTFSDDLRFLLLVSEVTLGEAPDPAEETVEVTVSRAAGTKCERCWNYSTDVGQCTELPTVCSRCYQTLRAIGVI